MRNGGILAGNVSIKKKEIVSLVLSGRVKSRYELLSKEKVEKDIFCIVPKESYQQLVLHVDKASIETLLMIISYRQIRV